MTTNISSCASTLVEYKSDSGESEVISIRKAENETENDNEKQKQQFIKTSFKINTTDTETRRQLFKETSTNNNKKWFTISSESGSIKFDPNANEPFNDNIDIGNHKSELKESDSYISSEDDDKKNSYKEVNQKIKEELNVNSKSYSKGIIKKQINKLSDSNKTNSNLTNKKISYQDQNINKNSNSSASFKVGSIKSYKPQSKELKKLKLLENYQYSSLGDNNINNKEIKMKKFLEELNFSNSYDASYNYSIEQSDDDDYKDLDEFSSKLTITNSKN